MTPQDREAFLQIVLGFAELKGKQLSAPALELYWRAMRHWELEAFQAAAEQLLRTCEFMPVPKDFEDLRKAGRPTAGEAWITALGACSSAIQCGHVTARGSCGDELIDRVVRAIGGYGLIAMCETDRLPFLERRFCEHYEHMLDAQETRDAVPQIAQTTTRRLNGPVRAGELLTKLGERQQTAISAPVSAAPKAGAA